MNNYHEDISAEQIRQQMDYVRNELEGGVDQVVEHANSLSDVRAYVKAQPIGWMIAAAAVGYLLVPTKKDPRPAESNSDHSASPVSSRPGRSVLGTAFGMAATLATRIITRKVAESGLGFLSSSPAASSDHATSNAVNS